MNISVIIPAFRRPKDLDRCLLALENQTIKPYEIIVTVREFDVDCQNVVKNFSEFNPLIKLIIVKKPGQLFAWKEAFNYSKGEIVSFLDDDSEPMPDWIEQIEKHFTNSNCAGVGGYSPNIDSKGEELFIKTNQIGEFTWYGRLIGNFSMYYHKTTPVDSLRGANMSFRRKYIKNGFNIKLKGRELRNDLAVSYEAVKTGGYLEYNPKIKVLHHSGVQFINTGRKPSSSVRYQYSYNTSLVIFKYKNFLTIYIYIFYSILIGLGPSPGFLRTLKAMFLGDFQYVNSIFFSLMGLFEALFDFAFKNIYN